MDAAAAAVADLATAFGSPGAHAFATAVSTFVGIYCGLNWAAYRRARLDLEDSDDDDV